MRCRRSPNFPAALGTGRQVAGRVRVRVLVAARPGTRAHPFDARGGRVAFSLLFVEPDPVRARRAVQPAARPEKSLPTRCGAAGDPLRNLCAAIPGLTAVAGSLDACAAPAKCPPSGRSPGDPLAKVVQTAWPLERNAIPPDNPINQFRDCFRFISLYLLSINLYLFVSVSVSVYLSSSCSCSFLIDRSLSRSG